jgi:hypothetical protein
MAMFGLRLGKEDAVMDWISSTSRKSKDDNFIKNPFKMNMKFWLKNEEVLLLMDIQPLYFNFTIFGWLASIGSLIILGFGWWIIPGIVFGCLGVFWTSEFYYWMAKLGLRKAVYKGKVKSVSLVEVIREVVF